MDFGLIRVKIKTIQEWETLFSISQVRSFYGLTSFYWCFIKNFSTIMTPITDLMKLNDFLWTDEAENAFVLIKKCFAEAPCLALLDFDKFEVECDSSKWYCCCS